MLQLDLSCKQFGGQFFDIKLNAEYRIHQYLELQVMLFILLY